MELKDALNEILTTSKRMELKELKGPKVKYYLTKITECPYHEWLESVSQCTDCLGTEYIEERVELKDALRDILATDSRMQKVE